MSKRPALGKGLSALIGESLEKNIKLPQAPAPEGRRVLDLPLDRIVANRFQPRKDFDEEAMKTLTATIRRSGILQPLSVRPLKDGTGRYELIAGERRFRAAGQAQLKTVPAIVMDVGDREMTVLSLVENLQREDLNPIDEAEGLQTLLSRFSLTQEETARSVGKSRSAVANALRLLSLPESVRRGLSAGTISAGHGRALLALREPDDILSAYGDVVGAGLSVRETERHVKRILKAQERIRQGLPPPQRRGYKPDANTAAALRNLAERYGTKITLTGSEKRGRVEIHYFSPEDRDRVLALLRLVKG